MEKMGREASDARASARERQRDMDRRKRDAEGMERASKSVEERSEASRHRRPLSPFPGHASVPVGTAANMKKAYGEFAHSPVVKE
jgi:hypothetical protein